MLKIMPVGARPRKCTNCIKSIRGALGPRRNGLRRRAAKAHGVDPVTNGAALIPDEVDESAERCRQVATTGIVEERSREALPPRRQHRLRSAAVEVGAQPLFKEMDDTEPGDGCADRQV